MPKVHNKYHSTAPAGAVYCGRGSRYGNPYIIGRDGDRDKVCDLFDANILPDLDVVALRGKDLICFCKPKRCHCDSLIKKANIPMKKTKLRTAIFDIESDGLLDRITKVHVMHITEFETGLKFKFLQHNIEEGLELLENADMVVAHNGLGFDIPALFKLYPKFQLNGKIRDSLVMTRVMFSHQKELDFRLHERGVIPAKFIGKHSLDSWGYRIGKYKGDYAAKKEAEAKVLGLTDEDEILDYVWGTYTEELDEYCANDVEVTVELWEMLLAQEYPEFPVIFEHEFADYCVRQEANGFPFNREAALVLEDELRTGKEKIVAECGTNFPSRMEAVSQTTYGKLREEYNAVDWDKIDNIDLEDMVYEMLANYPQDKPTVNITIPRKTLKYKDPARGDRTAGCPFTPVYYKEFNPGSRQQVASRLMEQGWEPQDFTEKGNIKIDDIILKNAAEQFPIATTLADYFSVNKTLGQLADGDNGWLKLVTDSDRIHHYVNPCGAVTGRCTHAKPNLGQVPSLTMIDDHTAKMGRDGGWGYECRSLFHVKPPFRMMGSDLKGIELRCLAHYMAEFDDGEYGDILLNGDIHTVNMNAAGLETRAQAKTFIYATLYGAGPAKIGSIVLPFGSEAEQTRIGKELLERFLRNMPALKKLMKQLKNEARRGFINGIDGRRLYIRAQHAALNTLLQNAGAMIAKKWVLLYEQYMEDQGYLHSWDGDFAMMAFVHDEIQVAVLAEIMAESESLARQAALDAGDFFKFKIKTEADTKSGLNWAETH
jgi:hypothetical protein